MSTAIETVPTTWSTEDENFFRVVARVFDCHFTEGAGCLLASYDDEAAPARQVAPAPAPSVPTRTTAAPVTA